MSRQPTPDAGDPRTREREDPPLLQGRASYTADHCPPDAVHAAFLRSGHAHARLETVDVEQARTRDGVLAAFAAADLSDAGAPTAISAPASLPGRERVDRPLLANTVARYAGDPIAFVLAEDRRTARDAVGDVRVEYDRLPAVTDPDAALETDLPSVTDAESAEVGWAGGPASVDYEVGDEAAVDRTLDGAPHVATLSLENQRLAPAPLEPRSLLAAYDPDAASFTITASTQTPHHDRDRIAGVLGVDPDSVRVVAPAVGGGFGTKGPRPYPEEPLVAWAARRYSRPVAWTATRSESLQTDHQGRDVRADAELALDDDGIILALRVRARAALGAYPLRGPSSCLKSQLLSGAYAIPEIHCRAVGVLTNTTPLGPYRGAGRPEAIYIVERLLDRAAADLGVDPADLRRRNFPAEFPYETATGAVYDSGDYERALDRALEMADYPDVADGTDGRLRGVGIASFVENTSSSVGHARVEVDAGGAVTAYCGTADQGQGHATTFAALVASELGVPDERVTVLEGDTAHLEEGGGTYGSGSVPSGGTALVECARDLIDRGAEIAADHLEVDVTDVQFTDGTFHPRGAPHRGVDLEGVAAVAAADTDPETTSARDAADSTPAALTASTPAALTASTAAGPDGIGYTFGTHVAVVDVDPDSGETEIVRYVAVDDCGVRLNPRLVEGQIHGAVAQGIGQALYEGVAYNDAGAPVTDSFQTYALPRAGDLPEIQTGATVTPAPLAPHGAKGVGEAGTIAAPPAVVNAVVDALEPFGVETIDMPLRAERVWRAVRDADG